MTVRAPKLWYCVQLHAIAIAKYSPASSVEVALTEPECSIARRKSPSASGKFGKNTPLVVAVEESIMKYTLDLK